MEQHEWVKIKQYEMWTEQTKSGLQLNVEQM